MKIVCFGDSLTWGKYGGSYVDALASLMPEHTFINEGIGGNTVVNLLRRVETDVIAHNPNAVLIMVGGNDANSFLYPPTRPYYTKVQQLTDGFVSPEQFQQTYRELLTVLQAHHVLTLVALEPAEYSPQQVENLERYNALAAETAAALNIPVLDLHAGLLPDTVKDRAPIGIEFILTIGARTKKGWNDYETVRVRDGFTYTFDGLHFTPDGAKRAAALIADFIRAHV